MIPIEIQKKHKYKVKDSSKREEDFSKTNKLKHSLDHICVICGRVPKVGEDLSRIMMSPWHCVLCACPKCGRPSIDIYTVKLEEGMILRCKCGWEHDRCLST